MARINKCIELLEQGQDIFTAGAPELTYEAGREMAQTWADMILTDFEHHPFDVVGLMNFMRGLKDGGPTPSGHPTPTVVTTLPSNCISAEEVYYNAWQVRQVLTTGVHGILHTHARSAEAVKAFVATVRYVHQTIGRDQGLPEGRRGQGGQALPAAIWGDISPREYMRIADPWPLNPDGELMLGLKIEDRHCLPDADAIAGTPGLAFAEWGPGDMGPVLRRPRPARPALHAADGRGQEHRQVGLRQGGPGVPVQLGGPLDVGRGAPRVRRRGDRGKDHRRPPSRARRRPPRGHGTHDACVGARAHARLPLGHRRITNWGETICRQPIA